MTCTSRSAHEQAREASAPSRRARLKLRTGPVPAARTSAEDDRKMASNSDRQDRHGYVTLLTAIRRRIGIVLLCIVALPAATLALSFSEQKEYSATASLLFRDPQFDQKLFGAGVVAASTDPNREAATN